MHSLIDQLIADYDVMMTHGEVRVHLHDVLVSNLSSACVVPDRNILYDNNRIIAMLFLSLINIKKRYKFTWNVNIHITLILHITLKTATMFVIIIIPRFILPTLLNCPGSHYTLSQKK